MVDEGVLAWEQAQMVQVVLVVGVPLAALVEHQVQQTQVVVEVPPEIMLTRAVMAVQAS